MMKGDTEIMTDIVQGMAAARADGARAENDRLRSRLRLTEQTLSQLMDAVKDATATLNWIDFFGIGSEGQTAKTVRDDLVAAYDRAKDAVKKS